MQVREWRRTMLPAWSLKAIPLVFIILTYGLLKLRMEKPWVWGQGADMSLSTTCVWERGELPGGVSWFGLGGE